MFIGMDPPKHDRLKMLFQAGFTPKRIAAHEDAIRAITCEVLDRLEGRETCDLVNDVAQPVVSRVIGSFMGIPEEDDAAWAVLMNEMLGAGDPDINPDGPDAIMGKMIPELFERCGKLIAERRDRPTDDLTSVLVHAEIEGQSLEDHEIVMGFFLLVAAGNDWTKATYCSGMRALMEEPEERQKVLNDPSLIPHSVEESLRMFPAFAHFRRTATSTRSSTGPDQAGRQGRPLVRVLEPRRHPLRGPGHVPSRTATRSTRRSVPAAVTSASARRWRGWSCGPCSRRHWRGTRRWRSPASPRTSSRASSIS